MCHNFMQTGKRGGPMTHAFQETNRPDDRNGKVKVRPVENNGS
jgi:hypothetical protein